MTIRYAETADYSWLKEHDRHISEEIEHISLPHSQHFLRLSEFITFVSRLYAVKTVLIIFFGTLLYFLFIKRKVYIGLVRQPGWLSNRSCIFSG
jgi:hypothetical protein